MVLALPLRRLTHQDVAELRERPQQLPALDGRAGDVLPLPGGQAEERVGHLLGERGAQRQVLRVHLVDVDDAVVGPAEAEVPARGARVLEAHRDVARQLAVDVERVLVDVGRALVLVDELDLLADALERAEAAAARGVDAARERVVDGRRGSELILLQRRHLREAHVPVVVGADGLVVPRGPVDPVAGPHDRPRVEGVDRTDARRELDGHRVALVLVRAVLARVDEAAPHGLPGQRVDDAAERSRRGQRPVEGHREAVVLLTQAGLVLQAHAVVDRELGADPEVVLRVEPVVVDPRVERAGDRHRAQVTRAARGVPEQHAGQGVPRRRVERQRVLRGEVPVEREVARAARERLRVDADLAEVRAGLERVPSHQARHRGVGRPRVPVDPVRVDGAERVVVRDCGAGELVHLEVVQEGLVEAELGRVVVDRQRVVVDEPRPAVAERGHGVVAREPGVVERQHVHAAAEDVVRPVDEPVRVVEARVDDVAAGLVALVVQVEAGERHSVREAVVHLARIHDGLVVDLRHAEEVVRAVAHVVGRRGQVAQHSRRDGVDPLRRDDVAGERRPAVAVGVTRQRIVDGHELAGAVEALREVALQLARGGQACLPRAGGAGLVALRREPEERPVPDDRAAHGARAVVEVGVRQGYARQLVVEVVALAPLRTRLVEAGSREAVGAGLGRGVERAAAGPPRLRVVVVDLDGHVLDGFHRRVGRRAVAQVGDGHAVHQVVVAAPRAAAERQERRVRLILLAVELRVARGHDRRHRDREQERRPARARKRRELLGIDDAARRRAGRVDERRRAGHRDRLLQRADLQVHVNRHELLRRDTHTLLFVGLESGERRPHRVGARRDRRKVVQALIVRHGLALCVRSFVHQLHRHPGDDAIGISDCTAKTSGKRLRACSARGRQDHERNDQVLQGASHILRSSTSPPPHRAAADSNDAPTDFRTARRRS